MILKLYSTELLISWIVTERKEMSKVGWKDGWRKPVQGEFWGTVPDPGPAHKVRVKSHTCDLAYHRPEQISIIELN